MNIKQLEYVYNFHDCDVFTPFEITEGSVTVIFIFAKHLQYDELNSRYGEALQKNDSHLIAKISFSKYSDLEVMEWTPTSRSAETSRKQNGRIITIDQFDTDMEFVSFAALEQNTLSFTFCRYTDSNTVHEIRFVCDNAEVIEEKLLDRSEYDKLWEKFE